MKRYFTYCIRPTRIPTQFFDHLSLFNEIAIPGIHSMGNLGTPKLPASIKLIEIPFGVDVTVQVKNYTVSEYKLANFGITKQIMPVEFII